MTTTISTWSKMKVQNTVQIGWANSLKTHVVCHTLLGDLTESVEDLETKLTSSFLLKPIRVIYQDMLNFAKENK